MSGLLRRPGYVLRRQHEGGRPHYQQTFIDTYAKVAFAKLYNRKTPITAADLVNDRVVPFYDAREVRLCRVLTDRGRNIAETPSATNTSFIWRSRISTIRAPRPRARKRMASSSASTRRCSTSSIASPSARRSTDRSPNSRAISIPGSRATTRKGPIRGDGASARPLSRPSLTRRPLRRRK